MAIEYHKKPPESGGLQFKIFDIVFVRIKAISALDDCVAMPELWESEFLHLLPLSSLAPGYRCNDDIHQAPRIRHSIRFYHGLHKELRPRSGLQGIHVGHVSRYLPKAKVLDGRIQLHTSTILNHCFQV